MDRPLDFKHHLFILVELKNLIIWFLLFSIILISSVCRYSKHNDAIDIYYDYHEILLEDDQGIES